MGRAELGRRLKIGGHAHAQTRQAVARRDLAQQYEMWRRGLVDRRDTHQALDRQLERPAFGDKAIGLGRDNAGFLGLLACVDLHEAPARHPDAGKLPRQMLGQFRPVDRLDHIEQRDRILDLVGLQRPHEVKLEVFDAVSSPLPMGLGLLDAVFAEHALTGRQRSIDALIGLGLADGHQRDIAGIPRCARGRSGDTPANLSQAPRNIGLNPSFAGIFIFVRHNALHSFNAMFERVSSYYKGVMGNRIDTFADLIAPIGEDEFFAEYHDQKPLHIPAPTPDKLDDVMTWDALSEILNMTAIWSPTNLKLFLDSNAVPVEKYCRPAIDRNNQQTMQPDAEKVKSWLRRGASIVANDIDTLTPGLIAVTDALERRLSAKVQSNLYCSWQQHQAFPTHFDTHEVFALHVAGEKVWKIYEGRLENPIANDAYKNVDDAFNEQNRGALLDEVTLRPGDVLYIPRGQYHDALASSDGCIHLSFGVTHVIGFDVMTMLFEYALADPAFRANIPMPGAGDGAQGAWIDDLADRLARIGKSDGFKASIAPMHAAHHYHRGGFNLPDDALAENGEDRFGVSVKSLKILHKDGKALLESDKGQVPIPNDIVDPVAWIVEAGQFSGDEFAEAFPGLAAAARTKLIQDLASMRVIAPL
jgi:bifunctional lysine-specific demethylase and histidyl-hydroxylase MINA